MCGGFAISLNLKSQNRISRRTSAKIYLLLGKSNQSITFGDILIKIYLMKNVILLLIFSSISLFSYGQTSREPSEAKYIYCQIVGTRKAFSTKNTITIDYGQERKVFSDQRIVGEAGKAKTFNSMIDALNFMGSMGWEFEQAYTLTINGSNVYHYLLKRPATDQDVTPETRNEYKNKN